MEADHQDYEEEGDDDNILFNMFNTIVQYIWVIKLALAGIKVQNINYDNDDAGEW